MQGIKRRIVYVVFFELFAILLASTLIKWLSGSPATHAGIVAVASSAIALAWNFVYNGLFERWEARQSRKGRSLLRRAAHAIGFECGLVVMLVPRPSSEASSFADVKSVLERRCVACHAQNPPPKGVRLDDDERIRTYAPLIRQMVRARAMPPGNLTGMTDEERLLIERWNP